LNVKNNITATGALTIPDFRYSFRNIKWRLEEIRNIYKKTGKIITMYKMHHTKAYIQTLYAKRNGGGRSLLQIEATYKAEISVFQNI
jgi:hypothetical protein